MWSRSSVDYHACWAWFGPQMFITVDIDPPNPSLTSVNTAIISCNYSLPFFSFFCYFMMTGKLSTAHHSPSNLVVKSYLKEKLDILQNLTQKCTMMMMMILFSYWFESFCLLIQTFFKLNDGDRHERIVMDAVFAIVN